MGRKVGGGGVGWWVVVVGGKVGGGGVGWWVVVVWVGGWWWCGLVGGGGVGWWVVGVCGWLYLYILTIILFYFIFSSLEMYLHPRQIQLAQSKGLESLNELSEEERRGVFELLANQSKDSKQQLFECHMKHLDNAVSGSGVEKGEETKKQFETAFKVTMFLPQNS